MSGSQSNSDSPFQRFEKVMKALVQVPKKEIERKAAKVRRSRTKNTVSGKTLRLHRYSLRKGL
jgi:hypothetical protein